MRWSSKAAAGAIGGDHSGPEVEFDGASIDSRTIKPGQLFVPIRAERDGHDYIEPAFDGGAAAYLTEKEPVSGTAILVANTRNSLQRLGLESRNRLPDAVVGITGSVGKTSVKELTRAALGGAPSTYASPSSFNNELGLPLTFLGADSSVSYVIAEMGTRGPGQIRDLCEIARPTVGIVTAVGLAHIEQFKTLSDVANAKRELVEYLPASGLAVLNNDDRHVSAMKSSTVARTIRFGLSADADVSAIEVTLDRLGRASFQLLSPWGSAFVQLGVAGHHQVANALSAAVPALWWGFDPERVAIGLASAEPSSGRSEIILHSSGTVIIDDTYNANPTSMLAGLDLLSDIEVSHRIAILGPMAELGDISSQAHKEVVLAASRLGIELMTVGTATYGKEPVTAEQVVARVQELGGTAAVLVKGSRVARMERIVALLEDGLEQQN